MAKAKLCIARGGDNANWLIDALDERGITAHAETLELSPEASALAFVPIWVSEGDLEHAQSLLQGLAKTSRLKCINCGYSVAQIGPRGNCPECGSPFDTFGMGPPSEPDRECPQCGEMLPCTFDACWRCSSDSDELGSIATDNTAEDDSKSAPRLIHPQILRAGLAATLLFIVISATPVLFDSTEFSTTPLKLGGIIAAAIATLLFVQHAGHE